MTTNCSLISQHCTVCNSTLPPLTQQEVDELLITLKPTWEVNELGHLYKKFNFKDFLSAMEFANKITVIAEQEGHHPNLLITWGKCIVEIWTHKINGLTQNDFILASKIEILSK